MEYFIIEDVRVMTIFCIEEAEALGRVYREMTLSRGGDQVVILRKATLADAKVLHTWRNDPATMAGVGHAAPMSFKEHAQWLAGHIGQEDRHLYLAYWRHLTIGTGLIDMSHETAWLSWTIAPEHRGHGFARRLIRSLVQEAQLLGYRNLGAKIRTTNPIALRLAQECRELSVIWVLP